MDEFIGFILGAMLVVHLLSTAFIFLTKPHSSVKPKVYRVSVISIAIVLSIFSIYGWIGITKHHYYGEIETDFYNLQSISDDVAQIRAIQQSMKGVDFDDVNPQMIFAHLYNNDSVEIIENQIIRDNLEYSHVFMVLKYGEEIAGDVSLIESGAVQARFNSLYWYPTKADTLKDITSGVISSTLGLPTMVVYAFFLDESVRENFARPIRSILRNIRKTQTDSRKGLRYENEVQNFLWQKGYLDTTKIPFVDWAAMQFAYLLSCLPLLFFSKYRQWRSNISIQIIQAGGKTQATGVNKPNLTPIQTMLVGLAYLISGIIYRLTFGIFAPELAQWTRDRMLRNRKAIKQGG